MAQRVADGAPEGAVATALGRVVADLLTDACALAVTARALALPAHGEAVRFEDREAVHESHIESLHVLAKGVREALHLLTRGAARSASSSTSTRRGWGRGGCAALVAPVVEQRATALTAAAERLDAAEHSARERSTHFHRVELQRQRMVALISAFPSTTVPPSD